MSQDPSSVFETARRLRKLGSCQKDMGEGIDLIIVELKAGRAAAALSILETLRPALDGCFKLADQYPQLLVKDHVELMVRTQTIYELQLELATLKGDKELTEACKFQLERLNEFFSTAISDSDFECDPNQQ